MPSPLFDRQSSLLQYLTSGSAIFGAAAPLPPALAGMNRGQLHLEARFSHEKRIAKIMSVLPRSWALLGDRDRLIADFVASCPPETLATVANARQFVRFLGQRWQAEAPLPAYLPDIAACEIAWATLRSEDEELREMSPYPAKPGAIRRVPGVILLRCAHDVRPIFEGEAGVIPVARDTPVAIFIPPGSDRPVFAELQPKVFALLALLDEFTNPATLPPVARKQEMIEALTAHGLIEVAA